MLGAATLAAALGMAVEPARYRYRRHHRRAPQVRERTLTQEEMTVPYPPPSVVLQRVRPAAVPADWATVGDDKGFSNFEERWRGR